MEYIPEHMLNSYTLNGQIPVRQWFFNDAIEKTAITTWSNTYLQSFIDRFTFDNIINQNTGGEQYLHGANYHLNAILKYIDNIKNKHVAVIGSQYPWIEAILVNAGAKSITTVEYNVPVCNHNIIKTISYDVFCMSTDKYDAIFSYSSIEHSGLGRYGDPLNPTGDIETMAHIYGKLNTNGYCFLGVPVGKDLLAWNACRIYGEKRLKLLLLDKFKEIEWIGCDRNYVHTETNQPGSNPKWEMQPIIVLQK